MTHKSGLDIRHQFSPSNHVLYIPHQPAWKGQGGSLPAESLIGGTCHHSPDTAQCARTHRTNIHKYCAPFIHLRSLLLQYKVNDSTHTHICASSHSVQLYYTELYCVYLLFTARAAPALLFVPLEWVGVLLVDWGQRQHKVLVTFTLVSHTHSTNAS